MNSPRREGAAKLVLEVACIQPSLTASAAAHRHMIDCLVAKHLPASSLLIQISRRAARKQGFESARSWQTSYSPSAVAACGKIALAYPPPSAAMPTPALLP